MKFNKKFDSWDVLEHCSKEFEVRYYQDLHRPLLREEGDGAPASSGTQ